MEVIQARRSCNPVRNRETGRDDRGVFGRAIRGIEGKPRESIKPSTWLTSLTSGGKSSLRYVPGGPPRAQKSSEPTKRRGLQVRLIHRIVEGRSSWR